MKTKWLVSIAILMLAFGLAGCGGVEPLEGEVLANCAVAGGTTDCTADTVYAGNQLEVEFDCGLETCVCTVGDGPAEVCTSPKVFSFSEVPEGPLTISIGPRDWTLLPARIDVYVDHTPPVVTCTSCPPALTNLVDVTFEFEADEPSTFACTLDGVAIPDCASPVAATVAANAAHTFDVVATDRAGNVGTLSNPFTVDTIAPVVVISSNPANPSAGASTFEFSCVGDTCTYECRLDVVAPPSVYHNYISCTSPWTYPVLPPGGNGILYLFSVRATDEAGNVSAAATYQWLHIP